MEIARVDRQQANRASSSLIRSSIIAVGVYVLSFIITGLFLGLFIYVFIKTKSYAEDEGCFLYSADPSIDLNKLGAVCEGSIVVICLLALLEIILVCLGVASIVSGRRTTCKCLEIVVVMFCAVLVTALAMFLSFGVYYQRNDLCGNDSTCNDNQYYFYVISWGIVVLFFVAFMVQFVDCICYLSSRSGRNSRSTDDDNQTRDGRYLLRDSHGNQYYS